MRYGVFRDISVDGKIPLACITTRAPGTSSGAPIHFSLASEKLPAGETVVITEDALKAETLVSFRPKARVIATAGVSCSHDQIIEAARPYNELIAFDADHRNEFCRVPAACKIHCSA